MTLPLYLAMTAAEISGCDGFPAHMAYMACHFSAYSTGLSNLPETLPKDAMLILNDRIPVCGHDPQRIAAQLDELCCMLQASCLLLDLQRPDEPLTHQIIQNILQKASCPVGVSELYAQAHNCPVFLNSPPIHQPLAEYIAPWSGREIWLEAAPDSCVWTVTETESHFVQGDSETATIPCQELNCHYNLLEKENCIKIPLARNLQDLSAMLDEAAGLGITKAVGLYQQLPNGIK